MAEPGLFVGARAAEMDRRPIAGSTARPCAKCSEPTVFSPATLARPEATHPGSKFVCLDCADLDGLVIMPPTQQQREELLENGHDTDAWPLKELWGKKAVRRG